MQQLKDIDFSSEDFDLLFKSLDTIIQHEKAGQKFADMMISTMFGKDSELKDKVDDMNRKDNLQREQKRKEMEEDIIILKSKLLQFKRHLQQEGALKEAVKILHNDDNN